MDLEALKYFVSIANGMTFTQTADKYNITQSAVSKAISKLESEFGLQLIVRSNRVSKLTAAGEQLLNNGENLLAEYDKLCSNMQALLQTPTVKVSVVAQNWDSSIHSLVRNFTRNNPQYRIMRESAVPSNELAIKMLKNHEADFVFMHLPFDSSNTLTGIKYDTLCTDELLVIAPLKHPLAKEERVSPQQLHKAQPLTCEFTYNVLEEIFGLCGLKNSSLNVADYRREDLMYDVVARNNVTIYYESNMGLVDKSRIVCRPLDGFSNTLILASLRGGKLSTAAKEFRKFVVSYFKNGGEI